MGAKLVRVRDKFQLTIPVEARQHLALREGDLLEATVTDDGIVFSPQRLAAAAMPRSANILDFLREHRPQATRTRAAIEASLGAERDAWNAP